MYFHGKQFDITTQTEVLLSDQILKNGKYL